MNLSTVGTVRRTGLSGRNNVRALHRRRAACCGIVLSALAVAVWPAAAEETESDAAAAPTTSATPTSAERGRALDAVYGYKGWNVHFPSYGDSMVNDDDYWRTDLAKHGFGFSIQGSAIYQQNLLNTPRNIPWTGYATCTQSSIDYGCAGGRSYFGQRPSMIVGNSAYLTYDLSQYGIPDGQLAGGLNVGISTDQQYNASTTRGNGFSYYQTLFDKTLEFKIGYFANMPEFAGTFVGGLVVNPFGTTASIPVILGMTPNSLSTPNMRVKWNITKALYVQVAAQRSLPVHAPIGGPTYGEVANNPSGLNFKSSVPGTRMLYLSEAGYRKNAAPDSPYVWLRAGYLKNTSTFVDYSKMPADTKATKDGAHGYYVLADYQITQSAPGSPATAYRGWHIGGSYMYGDPASAPFTRYLETRAYLIGPSERRPSDMLTMVYTRNKVSPYLRNGLLAFQQYTNFEPIKVTNGFTTAYTYRIRSGLYGTAGLGYTDEPSLTKFKGEGHSLNALLSLYWIL